MTCVVDEGAAICRSSIPSLHMPLSDGCPVLCGAQAQEALRGVRSRGGKRPALRHVLAAAAAAAGAACAMYWPGLS